MSTADDRVNIRSGHRMGRNNGVDREAIGRMVEQVLDLLEGEINSMG